MGLKKTGLDDFTPEQKGTAKSILNAPPPEAPKKDYPLQLRINYYVYLQFGELCERSGTDMSKALRAYINASIARDSL